MRLLQIGLAVIGFTSLVFGQAPTVGGCPSFPANSIWNTAIDTLPVDPNSAAYIASISANTGLRNDVSMPINFVSGTQPKVPILLSDPSESDPGPYPIPPDAQVEGGSDLHVLVVDKDNCILYETFLATLQSDGSWSVGSAAKWSLTSNALRPAGWTSADAAGLPITPGLLRYDEMVSGQINHALRFTAPHTQRLYVWPARHVASFNTSPALPPMGQRFRLKAGFDTSGFSPNMQTILRALKKYGLILADNGLPWFLQGQTDSRWNGAELDSLRAVLGSNLEAVNVSSLMVDADSGQALQPGSPNLATGKPAMQSSTLPGYPSAAAGTAVDGNTDGNFFDGSVSHTNVDVNAWWQVDLGSSATVNSIAIWNRTDCCGARLNDYWVFVSDIPFAASDSPLTLQGRAGTWSSHQTAAPTSASTIMAGAQGRYVRVQLNGTGYLSLAEVQVFGAIAPGSNLALGKTATQSSTLPGFGEAGAGAAVDGNPDGDFFDGSVTHTNFDNNAWWQVDLGASAAISSITIWNRTDCCGARLNDYWVFVSDTPFNPADTPATLESRAGTWSSHQTSAPSPAFTTTGAQGRYVRVQLSGTNYLSLAEVQVFGSTGASGSNVALGRVASQSSTLAGFPTVAAGAAVDGNTDGNLFDGSVTHTDLDLNAWWQVDLGSSTAIASIVVWNRTDCCGTRLNDYWVFVSDTPFSPSDTPATLQNRAGIFSSHQTAAPAPSVRIAAGAQGRYVRVQLTGTNYLSLAEVQVIAQ